MLGHGGGVSAEAVSEVIGFVEKRFAGCKVSGFHESDGIGCVAQFVHAITWVSGIVCLAEDAADAGDESCGQVEVVLATVCGGEGELSNAAAYMLPSGCASGEACVGHCGDKKKLDKYRSAAITMIVMYKSVI